MLTKSQDVQHNHKSSFLHVKIIISEVNNHSVIICNCVGAFGTLGVGGGFALGAKLCRPDSEVQSPVKVLF